MCTCAHISQIYRYILLSPYTVTCVYVFRADRLELDSQLSRSSLGKTTVPSLSVL